MYFFLKSRAVCSGHGDFRGNNIGIKRVVITIFGQSREEALVEAEQRATVDAFVIADLPDHETASALSMAINATGTVTVKQGF